MAMIDPEKERARLAEVYSRQTDEKLEEVAAHQEDLTDVALQSLRAELSRRGLMQEPSEEFSDVGQDEPKFRNLNRCSMSVSEGYVVEDANPVHEDAVALIAKP